MGIERDGCAIIEGDRKNEIFLRQVPKFSQFVCRSAPALESGSEILLR